jgi:hypothetical protein
MLNEIPDLVGLHGKAWVYRLAPKTIDESATLKMWIVSAPWAHPAWHSYAIGVIHLRTIVGVAPAKRYHSDATHEVMVAALDPEKPIELDKQVAFLTPMNYMEQFKAESDEAALKHVEQAVQDICDGKLSPDTDFKLDWLARFPYQNPGRRTPYPRSAF